MSEVDQYGRMYHGNRKSHGDCTLKDWKVVVRSFVVALKHVQHTYGNELTIKYTMQSPSEIPFRKRTPLAGPGLLAGSWRAWIPVSMLCFLDGSWSILNSLGFCHLYSLTDSPTKCPEVLPYSTRYWILPCIMSTHINIHSTPVVGVVLRGCSIHQGSNYCSENKAESNKDAVAQQIKSDINRHIQQRLILAEQQNCSRITPCTSCLLDFMLHVQCWCSSQNRSE